MTTNLNSGSAKIYQFPARGRFALVAHNDELDQKVDFSRVAKVACSGAWYHEAAVQENERGNNK